MKESKFLGLRSCIYKVDDLHRAKKWYSDAFEIQPYFDDPFYVGFDVGGFELGLLASELSASNHENILTYWGVDDIHLRFDDLLKKRGNNSSNTYKCRRRNNSCHSPRSVAEYYQNHLQSKF